MERGLNIFYSRINLSDIGDIVDYAYEIFDYLENDGIKILQIRYINGTRTHALPKIICRTGEHVIINEPEEKNDKRKLSALLYALYYISKANGKIYYLDNDANYQIATKHSKKHSNRLQKSIDKILIEYNIR